MKNLSVIINQGFIEIADVNKTLPTCKSWTFNKFNPSWKRVGTTLVSKHLKYGRPLTQEELSKYSQYIGE